MTKRHWLKQGGAWLLALSLVLLVRGSAVAGVVRVERATVPAIPTANNDSLCASISADGRYVAFVSYASNLVPGDTNNAPDVFVYDRQTHTIERVSVASDGSQANGGAAPSMSGDCPAISGDGRYVAFASYASNLVPGDTNNAEDIFVYDRQTHTTERISVAVDGSQTNNSSYQPAISADGRYIAFASRASNLVWGDTNNAPDVFVYDRQTHTTERVSVASDGFQANDTSLNPAISADGRYVAFVSYASNLVPGDTNNAPDVFVYDRQTHTTERVSVASDGSQANGSSPWEDGVAISADGRYVAFASGASNLVPGDTNRKQDIFVYDRQTHTIERVSVASDGSQGNNHSGSPAISADGHYVAFTSHANNLVSGDTNNVSDVFVYDRQTHTTERISVASDGSQANGYSRAPSISADGRYVAFESGASNLVPGDANNHQDIFVRDRQNHSTERDIRVDETPPWQPSGGSVTPSISADGRYVAFSSYASNLVPGDTNNAADIFVYDRQTHTTERVSVASDGSQANRASHWPAISADGRYVAFISQASNLVPGDTNDKYDVFVYDRQTHTTERVSIASDGTQANGPASHHPPAISADGRYVAFGSAASNLVPGDTNNAEDIFVYDRQTHTIERVSVAFNGVQANRGSRQPAISADGRYVAFASSASNLVPGDTNNAADIFVYDRQTHTTERVSVASDGSQANGHSSSPAISADGRYVAFTSQASNLVPGDTNDKYDVFVYDRQTHTTERVSIASDGTQANRDSGLDYLWYGGKTVAITPDGRFVGFESGADNLVPGDTNGKWDVFVYDRQTHTIERVSVASDGSQANGDSQVPALSSDGLVIAFTSRATNLVAGSGYGPQIYVAQRDITSPTVTSSTRADANPTNAAEVHFTVAFSEAVTGVDTTDFSLTATGGVTGAAVTAVTDTGDQQHFTVTVNTGSGDGTLRLDVPDTATITDLVGNNLTGLPYTSGQVYTVDKTPPTEVQVNLQASYTGHGPSQITVTFNEAVYDPAGNADPNDVTNPANYILVEQGDNAAFDTLSCASGVQADDVAITIDQVTYDGATFTATLHLNGGQALPPGRYRLLVCGTTSITDLSGNHLNGGVSDAVSEFTVFPEALPATGFAPGRVTLLPTQPEAQTYDNGLGLWLEIPRLGLKAPIVGVPQVGGQWDLTWLGDSVGWLEGTAFPTWEGNAVLTAHVTNADGLPGPFASLSRLRYDDVIIVHLAGQRYEFRVREVRLARSSDAQYVLKHLEGYPYLTLVTCRGYDSAKDTYHWRWVVRAVLVAVSDE